MRTEFRVPCSTGTYSDTLIALGLAKLLRALGGDGIRIQRPPDSSYYLVTSKTDIADASNAPFQRLFSRIITKGEPIQNGDDIDYDLEKEKRARFFEWRNKIKTAKPTDLSENVVPEAPRRDYSLISSLVEMNKSNGENAYQKTTNFLEANFGKYAEAALQYFSDPNIETADQIVTILKKLSPGIEPQVTGLQVFSPLFAKGLRFLKPNQFNPKNFKSPISIEMLKFSGWWLGAVAAKPIINSDPKKNEDLKVFVIAPSDITDLILESIMNLFRGKFYICNAGAVQTDICASLYLTEALLNHHNAVPKIRGRPSRIISGLHSAYFKKTNQLARSITNISFINLPEWLEVQDDEDRRFCVDILKEHLRIVTKLDESHGEAHNLLEQYRNFLSLNSLEIFLEFLVDYSAYAMRLLDKSKSDFDRPRWFSTNYLRRIFMGMDTPQRRLSEILDTPGFQNLAGAIRRSTRNALYAKISKSAKRPDDYKYEVRYGLAQELKRKAMYKNEFVAALAEFISEYMAENYRAAERGKRQRPAVTTTDLEQVVALMDAPDYDPETVAMLLIAYGYSKEPTEPKDEEPTDTNLENTDGDDQE
jgi:hypothetical protein